MNVSVIVPVYNVRDYLRTCVESVCGISGVGEILLIDDGSTDGSGALCDALAAEYPAVRVIHQENRGLSGARNRGIREAKGEWLLFLDSDDFLDRAETERMLAMADGEGSLLVGFYRNFYADRSCSEPENSAGVCGHTGRMPVEELLQALPRDGSGCYLVAVRFVVRRDFLMGNGLFFFEGIYHEDEEWCQRLLCAAEQAVVTGCHFYEYRQNRAGAITSEVKPRHIRDTFTILSHAKDLLARQAPDSVKAQFLRDRMGQLYLNNLLCLRILSGQERRQAYRELESYRGLCRENLHGLMGRAVRISDRLLGIPMTCRLLGVARRLLRR